MAGSGAPSLNSAAGRRPGGGPWRVAVVASLWHAGVMDGLVAGASRALAAAGAEFWVTRVPGAFELPLAAKWALTGRGVAPGPGPADTAVALGVVIRGGTPHFEYVCQAAAAGLAQVALETAKPIGFGLLTCDDEAQAIDRAGLAGSREDKGAEAAQAALAMLNLAGEAGRVPRWSNRARFEIW
ncbi:MAG: 6,7-dimethyl-8-ribityllumazine synthase [Bifidobacteriaceae bacterium]|jgi:6,7-dimethyl-8-ribityllumazine synthase|nr:6,7-dimethyl-8-ribityllumazine synthase [Bifidobacteriaceae bacterium]